MTGDFGWRPWGDADFRDEEVGERRTLYTCPACKLLTMEPSDHEDWHKKNDPIGPIR